MKNFIAVWFSDKWNYVFVLEENFPNNQESSPAPQDNILYTQIYFWKKGGNLQMVQPGEFTKESTSNHLIYGTAMYTNHNLHHLHFKLSRNQSVLI